jgi:hypothetical protein
VLLLCVALAACADKRPDKIGCAPTLAAGRELWTGQVG